MPALYKALEALEVEGYGVWVTVNRNMWGKCRLEKVEILMFREASSWKKRSVERSYS